LTLSQGKKKGLIAICILALLQSILRFAFPAMILQTGFAETEKAISTDVQAFILVMFVVIGIAGLITAYGLFKGNRWGYTGTIALSLATIVFDVWGIAAVQVTAMLGLVLPVVFIIYLIANRANFPAEVRTHESIGGVRN
jgi:uncharacterized membrane protein (DUF2068 family)